MISKQLNTGGLKMQSNHEIERYAKFSNWWKIMEWHWMLFVHHHIKQQHSWWGASALPAANYVWYLVIIYITCTNGCTYKNKFIDFHTWQIESSLKLNFKRMSPVIGLLFRLVTHIIAEPVEKFILTYNSIGLSENKTILVDRLIT